MIDPICIMVGTLASYKTSFIQNQHPATVTRALYEKGPCPFSTCHEIPWRGFLLAGVSYKILTTTQPKWTYILPHPSPKNKKRKTHGNLVETPAYISNPAPQRDSRGFHVSSS